MTGIIPALCFGPSHSKQRTQGVSLIYYIMAGICQATPNLLLRDRYSPSFDLIIPLLFDKAESAAPKIPLNNGRAPRYAFSAATRLHS